MTSINKERIALITTVSNWELYKRTRAFFPSGIKIFAIDGSKGFFGINSIKFFMKRLKGYQIDWLIMADEDVVFTNPDNLFSLMDYLKTNNFVACGMRDGGAIEWRKENPFSLNTFFVILNLSEIYSLYKEKEVLANQYVLFDEFNHESLKEVKFSNYDTQSLFEPYYCFFFWLLRKGKKIKYLDASTPIENDFATTQLYDHHNRELLYHTWFARFYKKDKFHTNRINEILKLGKKESDHPDPIILKNYSFEVRLFFYTWWRRILRQIWNG